jgi:hypothetical protein
VHRAGIEIVESGRPVGIVDHADESAADLVEAWGEQRTPLSPVRTEPTAEPPLAHGAADAASLVPAVEHNLGTPWKRESDM